MNVAGVAVVALGVAHLARACGGDARLRDLLFSAVFLSLVLLASLVSFLWRLELSAQLFWVPTLLAIALFVAAEAVADPTAAHLATVLAVGVVTPALVTVVHGSCGIPLLEKMRDCPHARRAEELVFVDLVCGTFHCVASLTVSVAVYLASRERDADLAAWSTATPLLLGAWCVVPLVVVSYARRRVVRRTI